MSVYFMKAESGLIKIGVSTHVTRRRSNISREVGGPVTLIREVVGDATVEKAYHERFAHRRVKGEWFEFDPEMLTAVVAERVEIELEVSREHRAQLMVAAIEFGMDASTIFRISFGLFKLYRRAKRDGQHLGFASDPSKLDREIMEVL